jgi:hypothetical protein
MEQEQATNPNFGGTQRLVYPMVFFPHAGAPSASMSFTPLTTCRCDTIENATVRRLFEKPPRANANGEEQLTSLRLCPCVSLQRVAAPPVGRTQCAPN